MRNFQIRAFNKYGLLPSVSGGSFFKEIKKIHFYFDLKKELSVSQMRELMVTVSQEFLDQINSDEQIREFLEEFPFQPNRLLIRITLIGTDGKPLENPGMSRERIAAGVLNCGDIYYSILNEEKPFYQQIFRESYQEAFDIVNSTQQQ